MKLDDLRDALDVPLAKHDPELFEQMQQRLSELGDGTFLEGMHAFLARYERGEPLRPHLPNTMQFLYMRDRQTFSFALIPELIPIAYQIGRMIGLAFDAPRREGVTLKEALESAIGVAEAFDYGRQEIVTVEENFAVYRTYECADCYGMPDIGMKICPYEAGTAAGALEKVLGKPVRVVEVKCCANGDPYDEFEVHVEEG
jgi:predicted hydrocarbon binding protein